VDGETYAMAQGALSLGGFGAGSGGEGEVKNHLTVGSIPSGAMVERSVVVPLELRERLHFVLNQPDFTTSEAISRAMNRQIGQTVAFSQDSRTVFVDVPGDFKDHVVDFIARLETLEVAVDSPARVVVNERTGTVVMGENVRISTVAVSHGGLSVLIQEEPVISQPSPFGRGRTVVTKDRDVSVEEEESHLMVLPAGVSLGDVVKALNAVGVTPRDLIAILQAIKAAGALSAELVIM
jgi:flagellar P-ring protein precursor FlgI